MPRYAARVGKYNAKRTEVDGIVFASKREAKRFAELKLLEKAGEIENLELQPVFAIHVPLMTGTVRGALKALSGSPSVQVATYRADFAYLDTRNGGRICEDVKGFLTPVYKLKKKMVEAQYGIKIREI